MYLSRNISQRVCRLFDNFPCLIVSGARQVGKTTLLTHLFGDVADLVTFDPVQDVENARSDPDLFLQNHKTPLILDEIQYVPELLPALKRKIDRDRKPGQYLITGSQQWGVLQSASESLAGRTLFLDLEGFSLTEITGNGKSESNWLCRWLRSPDEFLAQSQKQLELDKSVFEQMWTGFLPAAQFLDKEFIPDYYSAYFRTYIERDIRQISDVSDLQLYGRFVRLMAALTACEINYSQLGRELGLNPQTARKWLDMLKATFQWYEIPPYWNNSIKKISKKGKGYIFDTGLACMAQAISMPQTLASHPLMGQMFETAVVGEIRKLISVMSPRPNLYHWRAFSGAEVDVLIEYNGCFFPVEIKLNSHPGRGDSRGIRSFRKSFPDLNIEMGLIIAPCEKVYQVSDFACAIPWNLV